MDVVTAFLNHKVDGDVYMALPQGIEADRPQVCKLRKSLYGLKQAPVSGMSILTTFSDLSVSSDASTVRLSFSLGKHHLNQSNRFPTGHLEFQAISSKTTHQ